MNSGVAVSISLMLQITFCHPLIIDNLQMAISASVT